MHVYYIIHTIVSLTELEVSRNNLLEQLHKQLHIGDDINVCSLCRYTSLYVTISNRL